MSTYINPKYTPAVVLADFYGYGFCAGTDSSYSIDLLRKQGFIVEGVYTDIDKAKKDVNDGWLAWIHVEYYQSGKRIGHEVLITGIDKNNNFILADPYYGIGSIDNSQFPYGESNITGFYIIKPPIIQTKIFDELSGFSGKQIQIRASHYDPRLGGINCSHFINGQCVSHMASGLRWQDYVGSAIACPPEWPFHAKLIINGKTWECLDRGGAIKTINGISWIDFLSDGTPFDGYRYGSIFDAILILP
jgi:hypothetical protein